MEAGEPRLLRCPDLGLMIEVQVGRKWSHVIARDAREVFVKKVSNDYLATHTKPVGYPKGIAAAAEQFLNPALGVATITKGAQLILEEIMKVYSTKAAAKKGLERMGGDVSQLDALVKQVGGEWHLDDSQVGGAPKAEKPKAEKPKAEKPNAEKPKAEKPKAEKPKAERKQGAVWQVHQFCDAHREALVAGTMTRKEVISKIVATGVNSGTAQVQVGAWAKNNSVTLSKAPHAAA